MNKDSFKAIVKTIKYGIIYCALLLMIHVELLEKGIDLFVFDWLCGFSVFGFILLFMSTYVLKLCNIIRAFLIYDFTIGNCITYQRCFNVFGEYRSFAHFVVLAIGLMLIFTLFLRNNCNCGENEYKCNW